MWSNRLVDSRPERSWLLGLILDEVKLEKAIVSSADVVTLDLEDAVIPSRKEDARSALERLLTSERSRLGGRQIWVRINNLLSPWGLSDLEMLSDLDIAGLTYPGCRGPDEIQFLSNALKDRKNVTRLQVIIETPEACAVVQQVAQISGVTDLVHGPGDLSLELGVDVADRASLDVTAANTVVAARCYGLRVTEGIHVEDVKDSVAVRAYVARARAQGFDGMNSFYLPHMDIINDAYMVGETSLAEAKRAVEAYERAAKAGEPAAMIDGKAIMIHQYLRAKSLIADGADKVDH